jgi:hypothetical protein
MNDTLTHYTHNIILLRLTYILYMYCLSNLRLSEIQNSQNQIFNVFINIPGPHSGYKDFYFVAVRLYCLCYEKINLPTFCYVSQ